MLDIDRARRDFPSLKRRVVELARQWKLRSIIDRRPGFTARGSGWQWQLPKPGARIQPQLRRGKSETERPLYPVSCVSADVIDWIESPHSWLLNSNVTFPWLRPKSSWIAIGQTRPFQLMNIEMTGSGRMELGRLCEEPAARLGSSSGPIVQLCEV
ncbi:hypothetical protein, partial [Sphingomonas sp.]|uniref:hypothetical protein n=1 Tax=Sphingomonas sp. TaxID=28214 RepID=UPI00325F95B5